MLKIVIEKVSKGIKVNITGNKKFTNKEIASILLKSFIEYCKTFDIDVPDLLDELSKD